ncbi:MAG: hypothetical protein ACD_13C00149G0014 [uncultured bacterium]|nr:MAG: hypothetical protein ACD_13C00149G0014 [uncultured bacterium]
MPDIFVSPENKTSVEENKQEKKSKVSEELHAADKNSLSAFNFNPKNISFENREKEEKIILMLRQHPIVNLKWFFIGLILFVAPIFIKMTGVLSLLPAGYQLVIIMTWYLVSFAYVIEGFFGWYFNVFFITTRRVIDVDFYNLIDRRVSDAEIDKIQDVSYTTSGPIGTALNFGDISIQTSGEARELSFARVPRPEKVTEILDGLRAKYN